jgi:hypothetical protein
MNFFLRNKEKIFMNLNILPYPGINPGYPIGGNPIGG